MSAFNYIINITGDCQTNNSGAISILPSGGTPPYTVEWVSPDLGSDIVSLSPSVRSSLGNGTYALRLNDSTLPVNNEFFVNIPVSDGVCASVLGVRNSYCNGNNGSVTGTSNSDYSSTSFLLYSGTSSFVTSATTNTSQVVFNSLAPGIYYMVAQDLGGCTGRTSNFIIEDSNNFNYGLYVVPNSSCGGTPIGKIFVTGLTGTAPYTYQWNNGAVTDSITGLSAGNYSVVVTDANGCFLTKSGDIVDIAPIGFGVFTATTPSCFTNNGVLTLTITGGTAPFYYSASTGYVTVSYLRTLSLSGLSAGDYSINVTDAGLCSINVSTRLLSPDGFTSVSIVGENSTCSSDNGKIIINVDGASSPYTYTLIKPGGDTDIVSSILQSQTFSNLTTGTYSVVVQSSEPVCSYMENINIIAEDKFTLQITTTGATCGNNNGIIQVVASTGGTLPYTYSIDGINDLDGVFVNVTPGNHIISVIDSENCQISQTVFVSGSTPIDFSLYTSTDGTTSGGTITAFIGQGDPPFTFNWSSNVPNNPQQITVDGLTAGTYSLQIIDSNGCERTQTTTVRTGQNIVSLQSYVMGAQVFNVESPTKQGLLQMLNEGYYDLTNLNPNCNFISASFSVRVDVNPAGYSAQTSSFFTTTSLNVAPPDNLYYNAARNLILAVPGVGTVTIDALNNQFTVETETGNPYLEGQQMILDLIIEYTLTC